MNRRLALPIIAVFLTGAALAQPKPFVSWLISPSNSTSAAVEIWPDGKSFVWRLVSSHGETLVEMKQPVTPRGYTINYGECKVNGVFRQDVIAIVRHIENREWSKDIHSLWFPDAKAKSFIKGDPRQATCRNEDYGI